MTKQEQIEKMVEVIIDTEEGNAHYCGTHIQKFKAFIDCDNIAETLYNAGYRKADEVRKETAAEIIKWIKGIKHIGSLRSELDMIASEYGVEVKE